MRRSPAIVATAALLLAAWPARAQPVPQPQQSQQTQQEVVTAEVVRPAEGDVTSGIVRLAGRGSSAAGVKEVTISIEDQVVATAQPSDFQQRAGVAYEWDSYFLPGSSRVAPNGKYTVTVEAVSNGDQVDRASITFGVVNPPVAPRKLKAPVNGERVSLGWAANREPDIFGYAIERNSGKGFEEVARTRRPRFSEELAPGRYAYRVVALRAGAGSKKVVQSQPSKPAAAVIAAPPPRSGGGSLGGRGPARITGGKALGSFFGGSGKVSDPRLPGAPKPKMPPKPKAAPVPKSRKDNRHEEWGEYRRRLPYELKEAEPESHPTVMTRILEEVIPPDGARWVLIGAALLLAALVVGVMARRIKVPKGPAPGQESVGPAPT